MTTNIAKWTLVEMAKRIDPDGSLAAIAEILSEDNEILQDAPWFEANQIFTHKFTRRAKLPSGSWRKLNSGVATEASATVQAEETLGMLETYAEYDCVEIDSMPNPKQARMDEASAFLEGLSQTLAATLIYGNVGTYPERFNGLATRMASLAATTNVIGNGGSSALTSIYVVQWGANKVWMAYPKGHPNLGVQHRDLGEVTKESSNTLWQVYRDHFKLFCGLVVKDPRCIGRIANIESGGTTYAFNEDYLITLLNRMPQRAKGACIYANAAIMTQAEIALKDKANVNWSPGRGEGLAGEPMAYFRGCPVRRVDQITNSETVLT